MKTYAVNVIVRTATQEFEITMYQPAVSATEAYREVAYWHYLKMGASVRLIDVREGSFGDLLPV